MQKKVCFFIGTISLGGIGKLSVYLMEEFVKQGIEVDLFLMKGGGEYQSQVPKEVNIFVESGSSIRRIFKFIQYLYRERPTISISSRQRQDIVNIFGCWLTFGRTKPVVSIHTNVSAENKHQTNTNNTRFHVTFLSRILYRIPKKLIAVSSGVGDDFSLRTGIPRENIKVIYNPVYKPYNKSVESEIDTHPKIQQLVNEGRKFVISVGRLTAAKDFDNLINAYNIVRKNREEALVILGDGPLKEELNAKIIHLGLENDVFLLGFVSNPQYYIRKSSLFVMSSRWEGFGIVIVEALATGTPVVATDCPSGPSEILENGKYGKLVPVADPEALASEIVKNLEMPCHSSDNLIKRAEDFSTHKIANEYLAYIFN